MNQIRSLYNSLLAFGKDSGLSTHLRKTAHDLLVTAHKPIERIWDVDFPAKLLNKLLCASEVVSGNPRVQMMNGLELKTTMDEIQPLRTIDIHSSSEHSLGKGLMRSQIGCRHGKVR